MSLFELISSISPKFNEEIEKFYNILNPSVYEEFQDHFVLTKPLDHTSSKWLKELPVYETRVT